MVSYRSNTDWDFNGGDTLTITKCIFSYRRNTARNNDIAFISNICTELCFFLILKYKTALYNSIHSKSPPRTSRRCTIVLYMFDILKC